MSVVGEHAHKVVLFVRPYLGMHFTAAAGVGCGGSEVCIGPANNRERLRGFLNAEILRR
jgi:hypothetical protein